jgi:hypothetical protein
MSATLATVFNSGMWYSLGPTFNPLPSSAGHDAAVYGDLPVLSSHFSPGTAPRVGQSTACTCLRVGFFAFIVVDYAAIRTRKMFNFAQCLA